MTFKEKYKEELSDTRFSENFKGNTVSLLTQAAERKDNVFMKSKKNSSKIIVLFKRAPIAACLVFCMLFGVVAYATYEVYNWSTSILDVVADDNVLLALSHAVLNLLTALAFPLMSL